MQQYLALLVDLGRHVQGYPEKKGSAPRSGVTMGAEVPEVVVVVEALVTKHSSVPTLITAFLVIWRPSRAGWEVFTSLGLEQADRDKLKLPSEMVKPAPPPRAREDLVGGKKDGAVHEGAAPVMPLPPSQLAETAPVTPLLRR